MMKKTLKSCLVVVIVGVVAGTLFVSGFAFGQISASPGPQILGPVLTPEAILDPSSSDPPSGLTADTPRELQELFEPFWAAWNLVHEEYVDQPVDDKALEEGAIRGMLEALGDPHTFYMTAEEYEIANSDLAGELEGIGATVDISGEQVKIIAPLPGSPAEVAGLLPGDVILKVDGEDMTGRSGFSVIMKVRGPAGTTVRLTVEREGVDEPLELEIERAYITIASVESRMVGSDIAYVKLNNFGEKTADDLEAALEPMMALNPKGVILDLRGNPGGFLTTAIDVASQFMAEGTLMIQEYGDGREQVYEAHGGGLATDLPLMVLINAGSASASEIVAGAVQDSGRGTLVGETSFGKGSVQNWHDIPNGQGGVRITIARWLTPDRRQITGQGIAPDVEVPLTEEDRQAGRDPQLDAALNLLAGSQS